MIDRHDRVISLIQQLAAQFIQHEANTNPLITVTHVTISDDYRNATIFFTTIPDGREEDALIFLKRSARELRHYVMKQSDLKIIPFLSFEVDRGERHRQHIDDVARKIEEEN